MIFLLNKVVGENRANLLSVKQSEHMATLSFALFFIEFPVSMHWGDTAALFQQGVCEKTAPGNPPRCTTQ